MDEGPPEPVRGHLALLPPPVRGHPGTTPEPVRGHPAHPAAGPRAPRPDPRLRAARALPPRAGSPHTIWAFTIDARSGVAVTAHQMGVIDALEVSITPI